MHSLACTFRALVKAILLVRTKKRIVPKPLSQQREGGGVASRPHRAAGGGAGKL